MLNPDQRIGALRSRGFTLRGAARIITSNMSGPCSVQAVSMVVHNRLKSTRIESDLSKLMDLPYEVVWGRKLSNCS